MKNSKITNLILIGSGLVASVIGAGLLFAPVAFHGLNGIALGESVSLMSEIRAPGAGLLASGLLIISGAFASRMTFTATILATMLYLSYGTSRFISLALDGIPAQGLIFIAFFEIAIGLICAVVLIRQVREGPSVQPA